MRMHSVQAHFYCTLPVERLCVRVISVVRREVLDQVHVGLACFLCVLRGDGQLQVHGEGRVAGVRQCAGRRRVLGARAMTPWL